MFQPDLPIRTAIEDLLGRQPFAVQIARSIKNWRGKESIVIALFGPYGSGKSSLKNLVLEELSRDESGVPYVVQFNPWQWAGQEQILHAFFDEIGLALGRLDDSVEGKKRVQKWKSYGAIASVGESIARSLGTILPFLGVPGSPLIKLLADALKQTSDLTKDSGGEIEQEAQASSKALPEIKDELRRLLRDLTRPILVVVDDVDRLAPEEMKLLFQLIKVNADFPNLIYFVLGQRDILEGGLEKAGYPNGKDYLEKIVQVALDVPQIDRGRLERVLAEGIRSLLSDPVIEQLYSEERWINLFVGGLRRYFGNLRDVQRFLSTLAFHVGLFKSDAFEVNPIDLIAVETLRLFERELWKGIREMKTVFAPSPSDLIDREGARKRTQEMLRSLIEKVPQDRRAAAEEVLKQLFPQIQWLFGSAGTDSSSYMEGWTRTLRVCSPDIFDRYFQLGTPQGDVSQQQVESILKNVANREELVRIFENLRSQALLFKMLDRLEDYKETLDLNAAVPFITSLMDISDDFPNVAAGFFETSPEMHASRIVHWSLQRADLAERGRILKEAFVQTSGLYLPVRVTALATPTQENPEKFLSDEDFQELKGLSLQKIRDAANNGRLQSHPKILDILYRWRDFSSPDEARKWTNELARTPEGALDLVMTCAQPEASHVEGNYFITNSYFLRLKVVEDFCDPDLLREKIKELDPSRFSPQQTAAVKALEAAFRRRELGRSDDAWHIRE